MGGRGAGSTGNSLIIKPGEKRGREIRLLFESGQVESFTVTDVNGNKATYANRRERRTDYIDRTEGGPEYSTTNASDWIISSSSEGFRGDKYVPDAHASYTISGYLGNIPGFMHPQIWKKVTINLKK